MFASRFVCESSTPFGSPVLPEVYWISAGSSAATTGDGAERRLPSRLRECRHAGQRAHAWAEQAGDPLDLRERHEQPRLGVVEDADLARRVLLEPIGPERRVDRHRNGAGEQHAEERAEERRAPCAA